MAELLKKADELMDRSDEKAAEEAALKSLEAFREAKNAAGTADALRLVAKIFRYTGRVDEANELVEEDLAAFERAGDKIPLAKAKLAFAEINYEKTSATKRQQAEAYADEALAVFKAEDDKKSIASTLLAQANLYIKRKGDKKKNSEDAKTAVNSAVLLFRELGDIKGEATALHTMAMARMLSGAGEGAIRAGKEAIVLFQKAELRKMEAFEQSCIASWYLSEGEVEEAMAQAEEAMELYQEFTTADPAEAIVLETIVKACLKKSLPKTALRAAKDTLERFEESGNLVGEASTYNQMCDAYLFLGDMDKAVRAATNAADTFGALGDKANQGKQLRTLCRLHSLAGHYDDALRAAQSALEIFEILEDGKEQAITLQMRADVYNDKQETSSALRCAKEARDLFQDAKEQSGEAESLLQLAETQMRGEDWDAALKSAQEAQGIAAEGDDPKLEAVALKLQTDIHVTVDELDAAIRTAEKAVIGFRDLEDKEQEVNTMVMLVQIRIMLLVRKDKEGKATAKSLKDGSDKVIKIAKEALSTAKKEADRQVLGAALYAMTQVHLMMGAMKEALKTSDEAQMCFQETGDERYEANTLALQANIMLHSNDFNEARMKAEEAVYVFQKLNDPRGEEQGWEVIDSIERVEAERREAEQQAQLLQWQQQQAWMQAQQGAAGLNLQPIQQQGVVAEDEQQASQAGGGYEAKLAKLDMSSVLDLGVVKNQILEITKGVIGYDDEIEGDVPLMEAGLTSNTAVLLRDSLSQQLPGIPLPVTLIFDYPSIASMADLIVESSEKIAAKKAKAALK